MKKTWSECKSVRDIEIFLDFANFYQQFIKNFSRIAIPLTLMLRITSTTSVGHYLKPLITLAF